MTPSLALEVVNHVRDKIANARLLISEIEQGTFPHHDTHAAIKEISHHFDAQVTALNTVTTSIRAQPPGNNLSSIVKQLVSQTCRRAAEALEELIPVIGMLLRSTNVRVGFEIYGPLLRLARRVIGDETHLVISSEWEYSPFTYPSTIPELPKFVLIGLPASESGNGFILPAAGHELGHSVWNTRKLSEKFIPLIREKITSNIKANWSMFASLFQGIEKDKLEDLLNARRWDMSIDWCESQCTELFCDFCGLMLFGRSYLRTFSYLLSPNLGGPRSTLYPPMGRRATYLARAASALGIDVRPDYASAFLDEDIRLPSPDAFLLTIVDDTIEALVSDIVAQVLRIRDELQLRQSHEDEKSIRSAFEHLIPAQGVTSLQSVVNAAWDAKDDPELWKAFPELQDRKVDIINDLLLKTLEVMEYEAILGEPDAPEDEQHSEPA